MILALLDKIPTLLWRALAWLGVLVVLALSLLSVPVPAPLDFWNADKLVHMSMYASLMLCFSRAYGRQHWLYIALTLGLMGLGVEYLQSLTPDRTASWQDEMANLSGISIMLLCVRRTPKVNRQQPISDRNRTTL